MRIPVTYNLNCEISHDKGECVEKSEHCFITRNSKIVALIWLNPVRIEKGSDLLNWEREVVLNVVTENQYELEEAYRRVANGW